MSVKVKILASAGVIAGGCCATPIVVKQLQASGSQGTKEIQAQTVSSSVNTLPSSSTALSAEPSRAVVTKPEEKGNCQVIDLSEDLKNILKNFSKGEDDYVAVKCKDTDTESESKISKNWTGLFPYDLLLNSHSMKEGMDFEIQTTTSILESEDTNNYQTIFNGNRILDPITGKWSSRATAVGQKSVTTVTVTNEGREDGNKDPIYLLLSEK